MHIIPTAVKIALVKHTEEHAADVVVQVLAAIIPTGAVRVNVFGKDQTSFNSYTITRDEIVASGRKWRI